MGIFFCLLLMRNMKHTTFHSAAESHIYNFRAHQTIDKFAWTCPHYYTSTYLNLNIRRTGNAWHGAKRLTEKCHKISGLWSVRCACVAKTFPPFFIKRKILFSKYWTFASMPDALRLKQICSALRVFSILCSGCALSDGARAYISNRLREHRRLRIFVTEATWG